MLNNTTFKAGIALIFVTFNTLKEPDKEVAQIWYEMVRDIPDDYFMSACQVVCRLKRRPDNVVAEIREAAERLAGKLSAEEAYQMIEKWFHRLYSPEFNNSCWMAIQRKLTDEGHPELIPLAEQWGLEIVGGSNPTATRAQFRNAFEKGTHLIEKQRRELRAGDPQELGEVIEGVLPYDESKDSVDRFRELTGGHYEGQ